MNKIKTIKKVRIDFNEPHITYRNSKEQKIVGVTTALKELAIQALVGWAYKKGKEGQNLYEQGESANVGTVIHARILGYFSGYEIDKYNISQEVWDWSENSMKSFKQHIRGKKIEVIIAETPLISEKYQYGGTLDIYAYVDKIRELWDFKSGSGIYETNIYQLAALKNLLIENGFEPPERIVPVNIPKSPDSSFALQNLEADGIDDEFQIFLDSVDIYYRKRKIKAKKKGKK
ncbi:MAG: hypothetical protein PVJ67_04035 [Candidatus Pacearchaeota archaeon]|jgi:hypothetical protein